MANPYYIPRERNQFLDLAQLGLQLYGLKQRGDIAKKEIGIQEASQKTASEKLAEEKRVNSIRFGQGTPGAPDFVPGTEQKSLELEGAKIHNATKPIAPKQWYMMSAQISSGIKSASPGVAKAIEPLMGQMETLVNRGANPLQMKSHFTANWKNSLVGINEALDREMQSTTSEAKLSQLAELKQDLNNPMLADNLFPIATQYENEVKAERDFQLDKSSASSAVKTWITPDGKTINLQSNLLPPAGSVPYSTGMEITTGDTTIRTGVPTGTTTKPTQTEIEKKIISQSEGLARIGQIASEFKPEYQQIPTRLNVEWSSLKEKMNLGTVPEKDRQVLEDFSVYRQNALENINLYIKDITGAQMSEPEAKRLRKGVPDPGEGIFGGDSPTEFQSKINNTYKKLKASLARYNYYLKQGVSEQALKKMINSGAAVSIDSMPNLIEKTGRQLEKEIKQQNPGITMQELSKKVTAELSSIFGN